MIKISKSTLFNPAKIWISGIECGFKNVIKIANIFNYKWAVITIDSLKEDSTLLRFIKEQELKFSLRKQPANYVEISATIPYAVFEMILEKAISEDPENIFIFDLLTPADYNIHSQYSVEELIAIGITDAFISINFDKNILLISVNKFLINPQELYKKIKALQFD